MHGDECAKSSASDEPPQILASLAVMFGGMSPLAGAQDGPRRSPTGEGGFQGTAGMPAGLHLKHPEACEGGGTGRRAGLKIRWWQHREGSTPSLRIHTRSRTGLRGFPAVV